MEEEKKKLPVDRDDTPIAESKETGNTESASGIPEQDTTLFRLCVERRDVGMGILDTSGKVPFVNERLAAIIGYSQSEILGRPIVSFLDPEAADIVANQLTRQKFENRESYDAGVMQQACKDLLQQFFRERR